MPFKSEAQRRKFAELVRDKKISQGEFDKWNKETGKAHLPERVKVKARKPKSLLPRRSSSR